MTGVARFPMLVWLDQCDEPVTVVADMRDVSEWEKARHTRGWPPTEQAGTLAGRYMAWSALRRIQHTGTPAKWDDNWIVAVQDQGPEPERPTRPGPGPG